MVVAVGRSSPSTGGATGVVSGSTRVQSSALMTSPVWKLTPEGYFVES